MGRKRIGLRHRAGPRKVIVATCLQGFWGPYPGLEARLRQLSELIDEMAAETGAKLPGRRLDIAALPEFAVNGGLKGHARQTAQELEGPVLDAMAAKARQHGCYLTVPLYMVGDRARDLYHNVVALLDREGRLLGLYRYRHPCAREVANGLTPGTRAPLFDCDFGKVGFQICGEVHWDDGWRALKRRGAELVVLIAQPACPLDTSLRARIHRYHVLTSTWRDSAALFGPTGHTLGEIRQGQDRVLAAEVDLSYAILGWQPTLANGKALEAAYGSQVGCRYWPEDDCGLFWSNDPNRPIGQMVRELGLVDFETEMAANASAERQARLRQRGRRKAGR